MAGQVSGPLSGLRVLDLANEMGLYCTKLLADLGADVIKIEPPEGDAARGIGPFYRDQVHREKSLTWFHFNTNKRGITLNLQTADGRGLFEQLAARADVIVETFAPGTLEKMGLGWDRLATVNPRLILASLTPFGQSGPWRDYRASALVGSAVGGLLSTCGWPGKAPETIGAAPAYHMVSVQAAVGILMALFERTRTQRGRHVDVSMHASVPVTLMVSVPIYQRTGQLRLREGDKHSDAAHGIFPCKDGYIDFRLRFQNWKAFVEWLDKDGLAGELRGEEWKDHWFRQRPENVQKIDEKFRAFLLKYNKKELYEEGQERGFEIAPVNRIPEVAASIQLKNRNYFVSLEHPELGATLQYLGAPFRLSAAPWRISKSAPLLGEHNEEIYRTELGLTPQEMTGMAAAGVI